MLEIAFPLYFLFILLITKMSGGSVISIIQPAVPAYPDMLVPSLSTVALFYPGQIPLAYSPDTDDAVNDLVGIMENQSSLLPGQAMGFPTFSDMQSYYHSNVNSIWGGLNVDNVFQNDTVQYGVAYNKSNFNYGYTISGYATLQLSFIQAFFAYKGVGVGLNFSSTQFPSAQTERQINLFAYLLPVYFCLIFLYSLQQLTVMVITEKEIKIRESFKIMGMKGFASYLSWFITQSVICLIGIVVFIVPVYIFGIIHYSSFVGLFIIMVLYALSLIAFGFIITIFIQTPRFGTAVSSLAILLMLGVWELLHFFVYNNPVSFGVKFLFGLINGVAFADYISAVSEAEFNKTGISMSDTAFKDALFFLSFDLVLYLVLIWYLDNIYVGNYGVAKKWYYPFTKTYWSGPSLAPERVRINTSEHADGISVTDLYKVYEKDVKAVNGLSLEANRGEILALLGHNGAGKSTTINILTGLFPPTSGKINIMGFDYATRLDEIRKIVGYCPQHNVLLEQLTCEEHLYVFGRIKGVPESHIQNEISARLAEVGLSDKRETLSSELSGGMKRKLSIAIAFIGDSSLIFLDECTAGMDPFSRRKVWQLLQTYKSTKTIIMTTHFMEEAELLGDQIAIMTKGKLRCSGTSLQLKNQFGIGYILRLVKENETDNMKQVDSVMRNFFPACASLPSPSALEIIYSLPNDTTLFGQFFEQLQSRQKELRIKSFGLSMTTLEEVFLKIAAEDHEQAETKLTPF